MSIDYLSLIEETHFDTITDNDEILLVNGENKKIEIPTDFNKEIAVVGDHLSNAITFSCPKHIEDHVVMECQECFVKWQNGDKYGSYRIARDTYRQDPENEDNFLLIWEVDGKASHQAGPIYFRLCFRDYEIDEVLEKKIITYQWSSGVCKEFTIGEGIIGEDTIFPDEDGVVNGPELERVLEEIYSGVDV